MLSHKDRRTRRIKPTLTTAEGSHTLRYADSTIDSKFIRAIKTYRGLLLSVSSVLTALVVSACSRGTDAGPSPAITENADSSPQRLNVEIVDEHPWDSSSFTQGLEVADKGRLLVGTGKTGKSRIYHASLDGEQFNSQPLPPEFFGEGVTQHVGGNTSHVWQLTWQQNVALLRDSETLEVISTKTYDGEGWGLCSDGQRLVMSDGSGTLTFRDPESFDPVGTVSVTVAGTPAQRLNELDCDPSGGPNGSPVVWANVWESDEIYRIDPQSGEVTGIVDTLGVFKASRKPGADVLNGIAGIPGTNRYYLTGKYWDTLYEVRFNPEER